MDLSLYTPDIVVLSEHGLREEDLLHTNIAGYTLIANYCRKTLLWGGIAMYKRSNLQLNMEKVNLDQSHAPAEQLFETVVVKVRMRQMNLIIIGTYRSPYPRTEDEFLSRLGSLLQKYSGKRFKIVVLGDTNIDTLKPESQICKDLENILTQHGCQIYRMPATRITQNSTTSIDGCYHNMDTKTIETKAYPNQISDHHTVICKVTSTVEYENAIYKHTRNFSTENLNQLKTLLQQADWTRVTNSPQVDDKYNNFLKIMRISMDSAMPRELKKITTSEKNIFWDNNTLTLRHKLLQANNQYLATGSLEDKEKCSNLKKAYDTEVREKKVQQIRSRIEKTNNKTKILWKIINNERNKNKLGVQDNLVLNWENGKIVNPKHISDIFNSLFTQPPPKSNMHALDSEDEMLDAPLFSDFSTISESDIDCLLDNLKPSNSAGYDEITGKIMKYCKDELKKPLLDIANSSIRQAKFPSYMKVAKIYPKLKKGDKTDPRNYRPIANLPTPSKIIERAAYNQIISHLEDNNLLVKQQHGFRKNLGTMTAISNLHNEITKMWEEHKTPCGLFIDLQKAFDTIDFNILKSKLKKLKIVGNALAWLENYLTNRQQYVEVEHKINSNVINYRSSIQAVTKGVPQGSILGPLLFLIYINDFSKELQPDKKCILFADDTTILMPTSKEMSKNEVIDSTFNEIKGICNKLNLTINTTKTVCITFTNRNQQHEPLNGEIMEADNTKFLGILVDKNLTWQNHIDHLCKKLSSALYVIRRIRNITDEKTAFTSYHALFSSHLKYGIVAWGSATIANLNRVLCIQKRAIRTILRRNMLDHCKGFFVQYNILTVISLYIMETVLAVVKTNPRLRCGQHTYSTRTRNNIDLPQHRLTKTAKSPAYTGAFFFNLLPLHVKSMVNTGTFPRTLKMYLLTRPYYSVAEYVGEHTATHLD